MISDEGIDAAIEYMLAAWMIDDKREAFKAALLSVIRRDLAKDDRCHLYVDYDPQDSLLEATQMAGVACTGRFFSADGIFRWRKTGVEIRGDRATAKTGYGTGWRELWPNRDPGLPL